MKQKSTNKIKKSIFIFGIFSIITVILGSVIISNLKNENKIMETIGKVTNSDEPKAVRETTINLADSFNNTGETTSFSIEKNWNGMNDAQADKYRATFTLQKEDDSGNTDIIGTNGESVTVTLTGNELAKLTNLPKYIDSEEISYTATETKVEVTNDNGANWTEISGDNYEAIYESIDGAALVNLANIGDYVAYDASSGSESTFDAFSEVTGSPNQGNNVTFSNKSTESQNMKWRVLDTNKTTGVVTIMAEEPLSSRIALYGLTGAKNYTNILNSISAVYGHGNGATIGRSISKEDFEKLSTYDYTTYSHTTSGGGTYNWTKSFTSGTFVDGLGNQATASTDNPYTETLTGYTYTATGYFDETVYNMLFKNATDTSKYKTQYFVAGLSKLIFKNEKFANYAATAVNNGVFDGWYNDKTISGYSLLMFRSNMSTTGGDYSLGYVMPVIELQANIQTSGQNSNGVWELGASTDSSKKLKVTNTVYTDYKIEKKWNNTEDVEKYKSTFTLYKTINGEKTEAVDETGNIINKSIEGEGTTSFEKLAKFKENNEITYSVEETEIRKLDDSGEYGDPIDLSKFTIEYSDSEGVDKLITNEKTIERTTYAVQKVWNNMSDSQANEYKTTFKLQKEEDGQNVDVLDSNGDEITLEIRGNGTEKFTDLVKYADSNYSVEIKYSAVETKVEKTTDNGTTWSEVPEEEYVAEYTKGKTLANSAEVGDYVEYNPTSKTYTVAKADSGASSDQSYTTNTSMKWRILNIDKTTGKVTLMAEEPISDKLTIVRTSWCRKLF